MEDGYVKPIRILPKSDQFINLTGKPLGPVQTFDFSKPRGIDREVLKLREQQKVGMRVFEPTTDVPRSDPQHNQPTSSSIGSWPAFGCGTILVATAIFIFSYLIGLQLYMGAYIALVLVALASGLLMFIFVKMGGGL